MISLTIKEPIWSTRSLGIAEQRVKGDTMMEVRVSYKDKQGNLMYPYRFLMQTTQIRKYPTKVVRGGVRVHIVPIKDFGVVDDTSTEET